MASETGLRPEADAQGSDPSAPTVDPSGAVGGKRDAALHLSEALVGSAVVAVAVLAWAALGLAHLGWYSLPAALGLAAGVLVVLVLLIRRLAPVRVEVDRGGLVGILVLGALAAIMFLPGFAYGVTDKDPGGYIQHAFSISHTGSYRIVDPALDGRVPGGPVLEGPGARFGGLWLQKPGSDVIVPQFYYLWPALLAVTHDLGGEPGMMQTGPVLGVLAVLV